MENIEKENVEINDSEYWEKRFKDDWNDKKGPEQTAFFADLAFEYLPEWLLMDIRQNKMIVCDWGCAEGEAVSRLGQYLSPAQVYGVDVSETAIEHASKKFPNYKFKAENWLDIKHPGDEKVDVIFSSNTLEHFHDPMSILYSHLGNIARKYIIQMIPFEEPLDQMDKEHF